MKCEYINYSSDDTECRGFLAYNDKINDKKPCILVAHAWNGQNELTRTKAKQLAELGYVGLAVDLYGNGKEAKDDKESAQLMQPLFQNRRLLQNRIKAGFTLATTLPMVDSTKIGGIGFCFGGLAIIELLRSGADVKGVTSFHAVLGNEGADTVPIAKGIQGSLLILHGYDDPLVSTDDILRTQKEMNDAKVDWQMNIYGHTSHGFTNPELNDPKSGLVFNPKSSERSWTAMTLFFDEIFGRKSVPSK